MIGNDVVDIIQSRKESDWQRHGFLNKIFTDEEQYTIANYHDPEIMVWMLWSMKEAAYKIYNRQTGIRAYIPKQLICKMENSLTGTVNCYGKIYFTKTIVKGNCVYTVATIHKYQLDNICELNNITIIKDTNGLPYVTNKQHERLCPVSVSHHGRYYKIVMLSK